MIARGSLLTWLVSLTLRTQARAQDFDTSYKVDIGLYDLSGKSIWESSESSNWGTQPDQFGWIGNTYSLCPESPTDCDGIHNYIGKSGVWNAVGGNNLFNYLETQQFAIPSSLAERVKRVELKVKTPGSNDYRVLYKDQYIEAIPFIRDFPSQDWSDNKPAPSIMYPMHGSAGDPLHLSILSAQDGVVHGNRVLGVWISFRSAHSCQTGSHCCHLTNKSDNLWHNGFVDDVNNCRIERPHYECLQSDGSHWLKSTGNEVSFINFYGSLKSMADGKPISIHFDDNVQSALPFTNSYAETEVFGSTACETICKLIDGSEPWNETKWQNATASCEVKQSKVLAKAGLGPVTITGYGRLNGFPLMSSGPFYFGQQVWKDFDGTNGGNSFQGGVFKDHFKLQEWNIMSGLVELTTSDHSTAMAIDIRDIAIAWAPKRGDGAVLINAPYRPLDNGGDSNRPASLWDIKTPGAWIDAADGPNMLGDGSTMHYAYLHHADDLCKVSASSVHYSSITGLQGNIGSVIELGNYGDGLRTGVVAKSVVDGLHVHRIVHHGGGYDGNGGVLGTRTCPNGVRLEQIFVNNVTIPKLDDANNVDQLFAIGALGGDAAFCSGTHGPVTMQDIHFQNWRIHVNPTMYSKFYNDGSPQTEATIDNIFFYDKAQKDKSGILASAVQIFWSESSYYCVCGVENGADQCWNMNGPGQGTQNMVYSNVGASHIEFPYGPLPLPVASFLV